MREDRASRSVADAVLDALRAGGITVAFGIPGVHNLRLWDSARTRNDFTLIGVRHEQASVYAADGFARSTGHPAAAFTITGPGAANAVAAFGEAASCNSPVVLVSTEVAERSEDGSGSFGRVHGSPDQAGMFSALAKETFTPRDSRAVAEAVRESVRLATTPPFGPVYLDVPSDLLGQQAAHDSEAVDLGVDDTVAVDLSELVRRVKIAERPLVWVGGGAAEPGAARAVADLAEHLGAPVITTFAGRGVVAAPHPSWIGLPAHEPEVLELIARSDLLIGFGSAFDGMNTRNWDLPFPADLVAVTLQEPHLAEEGVAHEWIAAEVETAARTILRGLGTAHSRTLWANLRELRQRAWARIRRDDMDPEMVALLAMFDAALIEGQTLLADMAVAGYWASGYSNPIRPRQLLYPVGWGTLGFAVPASIGAAVAARGSGQRCLVVSGDGGLMMGLGELATMRQHSLPVTVLVVDDGGYGMLRFGQVRGGMEPYGVDLWTPDLEHLFTSFDVPVESLDATDEDGLRSAVCDLSTDAGPRAVVVRAALRPPRTTSPRWREPVDVPSEQLGPL